MRSTGELRAYTKLQVKYPINNEVSRCVELKFHCTSHSATVEHIVRTNMAGNTKVFAQSLQDCLSVLTPAHAQLPLLFSTVQCIGIVGGSRSKLYYSPWNTLEPCCHISWQLHILQYNYSMCADTASCTVHLANSHLGSRQAGI